MIAIQQAVDLIAAGMPKLPEQQIELADAAGQILAEQIEAERDQPPFDRVMMDGIAIAASAYKAGSRRFRRQSVQAAGAARVKLENDGNCIEVMTGAVLPQHCDCVVPIEQVTLDDTHAVIEPAVTVSAGQFIHPAGSDYHKNDLLLTTGTRIGAAEIAVIASAGKNLVSVVSQPAVEIFSVGDELADPGTTLGPGQIRRSNDFAVAALLHGQNITTTSRGKLPDDPQILKSEIGAALERCDLLVLTGGVSMGKFDYIPAIMDELGVDILLYKIAQTPGKPMWVGRRGNTMVFALPGNPVSALVCARRFVVTAIHGAMGYSAQPEVARLQSPLHKTIQLAWLLPVVLRRDKSGMVACPRRPNTSGDFLSLAGTAGFIELPAGEMELPAGSLADFWRW